MAEPITSATFGPMACMSRWLSLSYFRPLKLRMFSNSAGQLGLRLVNCQPHDKSRLHQLFAAEDDKRKKRFFDRFDFL